MWPCWERALCLLLALCLGGSSSAMPSVLGDFKDKLKLGKKIPPGKIVKTLTLTEEVIKIGGLSRESMVIDGGLPGPLIELEENKISWVRVKNKSKRPVTIVSLPASADLALF